MVKKNWAKVLESCVVAAASAIILIVLIYAVPNCAPIESHHDNHHNDTDDVMHGNSSMYVEDSHDVHRYITFAHVQNISLDMLLN